MVEMTLYGQPAPSLHAQSYGAEPPPLRRCPPSGLRAPRPHTCVLCPPPPHPQPTNFTNPVYATLYMGAHSSRNSLASTDEKRELLARGADDDLTDPLA